MRIGSLIVLLTGLAFLASTQAEGSEKKLKRIWLQQPDFDQKTGKWWFNKSEIVEGNGPDGRKAFLQLGQGARVVSNFPFEDGKSSKALFKFSAKGQGTLTIGFSITARGTNKWVNAIESGTLEIKGNDWKQYELNIKVPDFDRKKHYLKLSVGCKQGSIQLSGLQAYGTPEDLQSRIERKRAKLLSTAQAMSIGKPVANKDKLGLFEKYELSFPLAATYESPYDPEQIDVHGVVTTPSGRQVTFPAFYYEACSPRDGMTRMEMWVPYDASGKGEWRFRFAPTEAGTYKVVINAKEKSGRTATSPEVMFEAVGSQRKGFVRVSKANPMYFENTADGSLFWGTGANVAWTRTKSPKDPKTTYEHYFARAKGNMSATRVWLCHWAWLEWTPYVDAVGTNWQGYAGLGYYNQMIADAMDRVFALAEAQGLRIMLVTEDNNEVWQGKNSAGEWQANPYNVINGGPCSRTGELFSNETAKRFYRNRLRYIIARWGYSDSLWAINCWNDCSVPSAAVREWIGGMHDYTHQLVKDYRPIVYGSNYRYEAGQACDYVQAQSKRDQTKPNVVQECGFTQNDEWFARNLHGEVWNGLAGGLGAIMVWPHALVDRLDGWLVFKPVMEFSRRFDLNHQGWGPAQTRVTSATFPDGAKCRRIVSVRPYGDVPAWGVKARVADFYVDTDLAEQWLEGYCETLYASRKDRIAWRNPPNFHLDLTAPARAILDLNETGSGNQTLQVSINDQVVKRHVVPNGRRYLQDSERWVEVALPPGKVKLSADNTGTDWLRLHQINFILEVEKQEQVLTAKGRSNGREGFVYLRNQTYTRLYKDLLKEEPLVAQNISLQVDGLEDGTYAVEVLNSYNLAIEKKSELTTDNGCLTVTVDELKADAVVVFRRK